MQNDHREKPAIEATVALATATSRRISRNSLPAQMSILAREDDVLFCPGMDLLAMRAGHFSALDFCGRPQFFFDRLTARRQFCRRWATDEKAFDDRSFSFRRGRWCKKVHNNKCWLAEPINDARFIDIVR